MPALEVLFDVPDKIAAGLKAGQLERIGGVIVNSENKQVVAWLRDGVLKQDQPFPQALASALSISRGQAQLMTQLAALMGAGQLINLAVTAASFHAVMQRLDRMSEQIYQLGEAVRAEFKRDREIQFRSALQSARDAYETTNIENRQLALRDALKGLNEARDNFLHDFRDLLQQSPSRHTLLTAQHTLALAMYAESSRIHCYILSEGVETARRRLSESLPVFVNCTKTLVNAWLGEHPALYLHPAIDAIYAERFLRVQRWLQQDNLSASTDSFTVLCQILERLRGDFWNVDLVQDEYDHIIGQITRRPVKTFSDKAGELADNLAQAEIALENCERLRGFELELHELLLASGSISFAEWQRLIDDQTLNERGIVVLVDQDRLQGLRLSA